MTTLAVAASSVSNGALFELGALGIEERFTTCNPEKTLWAQPPVERHTNFAFAQVDFAFDQVDFASDGSWADRTCLTATLPNHGDLLIGTYARFLVTRLDMDGTVARQTPLAAGENPNLEPGDAEVVLHWCEEVGHAIIRQATWSVGNHILDRLTGEIMHVYHQLYNDRTNRLTEAIGRMSDDGTVASLQTFASSNRQLYVPLPFSYSEGSQNSFPMVAVQQDEITYELVLRGRDQLIVALDTSRQTTTVAPTVIAPALVAGGAIVQSGMTAEVIFLDKQEQLAHTEHPIEKYYEYTQGPCEYQVAAGTTVLEVDHLPFNHSVTTLMSFYRSTTALAADTLAYFDFSTPLPRGHRPQRTLAVPVVPLALEEVANGTLGAGGLRRQLNPFQLVELDINSAPRVSRQGVYWHEVQSLVRFGRRPDSYVMVYSFAESPGCRTEPTGALNVGRFTCVPMRFTFVDSRDNFGGGAADVPTVDQGIGDAGIVQVYARTQNFYKIAGQKLGLRWSAI